MLLLLPLLWNAAKAADDATPRGKDTYLDAFMESHASLSANSASGGPSPQAQYPAANPQPQYGAPSPQPQYGSPSPQPQYGSPSPQPQYGSPNPQPQYGSPSPQPQYGTPYHQPQYGPPQPQYGPPLLPTSAPVPFFEGLGTGLLSLLSQLPLPDFHTALKILLKVIVIKGVVKLISLLLVMLFIPKLEDILTMVSSLMEVDMDMEMDKDKPAKPAKPDHHDDDNQDQSDDNPMEETSNRRGRLLNALAARVEEAVVRAARSLEARSLEARSLEASSLESSTAAPKPCFPKKRPCSAKTWPDSGFTKVKKKTVNKNVE